MYNPRFTEARLQQLSPFGQYAVNLHPYLACMQNYVAFSQGMIILGEATAATTTKEGTVSMFDQSLFIVLLVLIMLGFEVQIVKIHQSINKLNDKLEKK